ncbi:MAG: hypothetical protein IM607_12355 [Cytophagales bacterium]|nr:hypothetical protein [Cytophagales bacterium]
MKQRHQKQDLGICGSSYQGFQEESPSVQTNYTAKQLWMQVVVADHAD